MTWRGGSVRVALVVTVLTLASCGGHGSATRTSSPTSPTRTSTVTPSTHIATPVPTLGEVCGVTALEGGALFATGVKDPALLRVCPSGPRAVSTQFSLMASDGKNRVLPPMGTTSGRLNFLPGKYRAVGAAGCPNPETSFVVKPRKTLKGVVVLSECDYE